MSQNHRGRSTTSMEVWVHYIWVGRYFSKSSFRVLWKWSISGMLQLSCQLFGQRTIKSPTLGKPELQNLTIVIIIMSILYTTCANNVGSPGSRGGGGAFASLPHSYFFNCTTIIQGKGIEKRENNDYYRCVIIITVIDHCTSLYM